MNEIPAIKIQKSSPEWAEIAGWCEAHLSKYRSQLESELYPADKIPGIRARIALLKALLHSTAEDQPHEQS